MLALEAMAVAAGGVGVAKDEARLAAGMLQRALPRQGWGRSRNRRQSEAAVVGLALAVAQRVP